MIFFLACRNLIRNIKSSLIILFLVTLIIGIFLFGNNILEETNRGLERSYVDNYTGQLIVESRSEIEFGIFGANTPAVGEYFSIPSLKEYEKIDGLLANETAIENQTSLLSGVAVMDIHGKKYKNPLFGIDPLSYMEFFEGIDIIEGVLTTDYSPFIMMTESRLDKIERETGIRPQLGDPVLLTMAGGGGFKIRELPLTAIFEYKNGDPSLNDLSLIDAQTLRILNGVGLATTVETKSEVLFTDSPDDLFASYPDDLFGAVDTEISVDDETTVDSVLEQLTQTPAVDNDILYGGSWQFILLKLKEGENSDTVASRLNTLFFKEKIEARVIDWREASGLVAVGANLMQILYNGGFFLILIAGIIGIVNVLFISVFRRNGEIGTLRAIGAGKVFIAKLFIIENLILSLLAGGLAILLTSIGIKMINNLRFPLNNNLLKSLFGSETLQINLMTDVALWALLLSILLVLISLIFPLHRALKIEPVRAVAER